ncbi:hypothetical protein CTZ27_10090 [Streptomyces griseocarneus]|nr:hypothetical protein CTZ27_10090 [Streptomyces griseocarneus]
MADPDLTGPAGRTGDSLVTELEALLGDTARAAGHHGWTAVAEAAAALPDRDDRAVLLCASPKADATALATFLRTRLPDIRLRTTPLEPLHADPSAALRANRVVLALGCAELLSHDAATAGAFLAARPPGTVLVVLTGADVLSGDDDLRLVARRIWRVLHAGPGERWTGRGLAELGCLLWSAENPADTAEPLHSLLVRDAAALVEQLRAQVAAPAGLLHDRVTHLLGLAAELLSGRTGPDGPHRRSAEVMGARAALQDARRKILRAVDGETAAAEREVIASLRAVEQDLLRQLDGFLERHRQEAAEPTRARGLVTGYLDRGIRSWAASSASGLRVRAGRIDQAVAEGFRNAERALAARGTGAGVLGAPPSVSLDGAAHAPVPSYGGRPSGAKPPAVPTEMVVGGALGAAAGAVMTNKLGTVLGAGVGAAAGGVLHRLQTEQQVGRAAAYGRAAVQERVAALVSAVPAAVRRETESLRRSVERTLDRAARELEIPEPGTATEGAEALGALRQRLAALDDRPLTTDG